MNTKNVDIFKGWHVLCPILQNKKKKHEGYVRGTKEIWMQYKGKSQKHVGFVGCQKWGFSIYQNHRINNACRAPNNNQNSE